MKNNIPWVLHLDRVTCDAVQLMLKDPAPKKPSFAENNCCYMTHCLTECELPPSVSSNTNTTAIMKQGKGASLNCSTRALLLAGVKISQDQPAVLLSTVTVLYPKFYLSSALVNCFITEPLAGRSQPYTNL